MTSFEAIYPSAILSPFVEQYWFLAIDDAGRSLQRHLPSYYPALAFHRGNPVYSTLHGEIQPQSSLCGQSVSYTDIVYSGNLNFIMVVFKPVAAKIFFGIPMYEFRNKNTDIGLLGEMSLCELENRLMETADNRECVRHIEDFLLNKSGAVISYRDKDKVYRMNEALRYINNGQQNITELSKAACLGYKQFKRVFREYTGLKPKEFLRITRFRKALRCLHTGGQTNLNALAYECDYCDKSHLIKDFKIFTGHTPKEFLSVCDPYSEYLSLFNSIFINGNH